MGIDWRKIPPDSKGYVGFEQVEDYFKKSGADTYGLSVRNNVDTFLKQIGDLAPDNATDSAFLKKTTQEALKDMKDSDTTAGLGFANDVNMEDFRLVLNQRIDDLDEPVPDIPENFSITDAVFLNPEGELEVDDVIRRRENVVIDTREGEDIGDADVVDVEYQNFGLENPDVRRINKRVLQDAGWSEDQIAQATDLANQGSIRTQTKEFNAIEDSLEDPSTAIKKLNQIARSDRNVRRSYEQNNFYCK